MQEVAAGPGVVHGGLDTAPVLQTLQAQPDAPAVDCARVRMVLPPRVTRTPLTVRLLLVQVCSLVKITTPPKTLSCPLQSGVKVTGAPVLGVKLTFRNVVPPCPQHTQVEIRSADRVPALPSGRLTPATNELALHELLSALLQATLTTWAGTTQVLEHAEPELLVDVPSEPVTGVKTGVAVAVHRGQLQAGEAAEAELTVTMEGATHAAPPTIALFFRKSRLLCSMD